jgi:hypothetical protein
MGEKKINTFVVYLFTSNISSPSLHHNEKKKTDLPDTPRYYGEFEIKRAVKSYGDKVCMLIISIQNMVLN